MDEISIESIKDALFRSGYLLENRVLNLFLKNKFAAESSHIFFLDQQEGAYREIDVIAKSFLNSYDISDTDESVDLAIKFVVECINNPVPLALFENKHDFDEPSTDWATSILNGSESLLELCSIEWQRSINKYDSTIFPLLPSRQYCSFLKKKDRGKDEWMASHPNDFHNTLNKLTLYTQHSLKINVGRWDGVKPQRCRLDLVVPIIVLQGEMFEIKCKEIIELNPVNYYRLKIPYEQENNSNLSIDIVTEKFLQDYIDKKLFGIQQMFEDLKIKIREYYSRS